MEGHEYNALAEEIGTYRARHGLYQVFTVLPSNFEPGETPIQSASTCSDFAWNVFATMKTKGFFKNRLGPIIPPQNTFAVLHMNETTNATRVSTTDPKEAKAVYEFYSKISIAISDVEHDIHAKKTIKNVLDTVGAMIKLVLQLEMWTFYVFLEPQSYLKVTLNHTKPFTLELGGIGGVFKP